MPKVQTPQTLTGLARVIAKHRNRIVILSDDDSGFKGPPRGVLIDPRGIAGFSAVSVSGGKVTIGTGIHFGDLLRQVDGENGLLKQAVSMMANPLVRNRVTVLSALAMDSPYLDLATALVSLGARVRVQTPSTSHIIPIESFLLAAAEGLGAGEFPAAVQYGMLDARWRVGFFRINPGGGRGTVSASVRTRLNRNVAQDPQIVVSSSTVIPVSVPAASRALARRALSEGNVKIVAEIAAKEMLEFAGLEESPYDSSLIEVAVSRAIRRVTDSARLV